MTADLPALQQLWEANDATEFEAAITSSGNDCWRRTASFRDCMDALMADRWPGAERFPLKYISLLDLHLVISGENPLLNSPYPPPDMESPSRHDQRRPAHVPSADQHTSAAACNGSMAGTVGRSREPHEQ
jgi:hypothetical protein